MKFFAALVCLVLSSSVLAADSLARDAVPAPLRSWVPWVMHGHETIACPFSHMDADERACAWPSELALDLAKGGGRFSFRVETFAPGTWVILPGDAEHWPQEVRIGNVTLPVIERDDVPQVRLPAGSHNLGGVFVWREMPQSLKLPLAVGIVRARVDGRPIAAQLDADGLLWLQAESSEEAPDALTTQVFRLVDDNVPMVVTTQFDLVGAGRPREVALPLALLEGFVPMSLDSPLPARLGDDGVLRVQLRPGSWRIAVGARRMGQATELALPKGAGWDEEVWAFQAHHDVRLVALDGGQSVDPKQTAMPAEWKGLPAVRLVPGETLRLKVARRGEGDGAADKLTLRRQAWLDFDGGGYTFQDRISGEILRSWRLEVEPGVELGRVAVDGEDQPITRLGDKDGYGIEVRQGRAEIVADSRRAGGVGELPGNSWNTDFANVQTSLNVPPGWRLLHASGVDHVHGSWIARWDLWAFFFVLLSALATARLFGVVPGVGCALALVLSWHLEGSPGLMWPGALGLIALERVLPAGRLQRVSRWAKRALLAIMLLMLAALAVTLVRESIYPALELPHGPMQGSALPAAAPVSARGPAADAMPAPAAAPPMEEMQVRSKLAEPRLSGSVLSREVAEAKRQQKFGLDPSARVQTGPGLPNWRWREYSLSWSGPVESGQKVGLWLLPPMLTALMNLVTVLALAYLFRVLVGWPKSATWRHGGGGMASVVLLFVLAGAGMTPEEARAAAPALAEPPAADASPATPSGIGAPSEELMQALRDKLTQRPDCLPHCAELARLHVLADTTSVRLHLQFHAQAPVMAPLPGNKEQFAPDKVLLDGKAAALRRDEEGTLWISLHAGVNDIVMEAAASGDTMQVALPLVPRQLMTSLAGWSLNGLDARGRQAVRSPWCAPGRLGWRARWRRPGAATVRARDPRSRAHRSLDHDHHDHREGPSPLPMEVRVTLLPGEAVTDADVRVEKDVAVVVVGQGGGAGFHSNIAESATLKFEAGSAPNQIETWRVDADPRWHIVSSGLDPVRQRDESGGLAPLWQPWPGESMQLAVSRPKGVAGQTLTVDALSLSFRPGQRATDVAAQFALRSSQGRNHVVELPDGVQLQTVAIDGRPLPIRAQGRALTLPIEPGAHRVVVEWREPRGMDSLFRSSALKLDAAGANASIELRVPGDRVVLATGGPVLGPAVLFWGVLAMLFAGAWILARLRIAPLSFRAWVLLGVGLAQSYIVSVAIVVAWFAAFGLRERFAAQLAGRAFKLVQVGLTALSLLAVVALLGAIHAGLLGYPDLMIEGNGSSSHYLSWFADRLGDAAPHVWVVSVPLWVFRVAMLLWALWLAGAMLGWVKWAWSAFSANGYWPPAGDPTKRGWFGGRRREPPAQSAERAPEKPATSNEAPLE